MAERIETPPPPNAMRNTTRRSNNNNNSNINTGYNRTAVVRLCGHRVSNRSLETPLQLRRIALSADVLSQGTFGKVVSAGIEYTEGNSATPKQCTAAVKQSKVAHTELPYDVVTEAAIYARTQKEPHLVKALFMHLVPNQISTVMNHYLMDFMTMYERFLLDIRAARDYERLLKCIFFQILTGTAALHRLSILHRDIKLENIFIAKDGTVSLGDFGLSLHIPVNWDQLHVDITSAGTADYQPPEAFVLNPKDRVISTNFDTWSIGVMLSYCLQDAISFRDTHLSIKGRSYATILKAFATAKGELLKHLQAERGRGALVVSDTCLNFLNLCLQREYARRPYPVELLSHAWFSGLTLDAAKDFTRQALEHIPASNTGERMRNVSRSIKHRAPRLGAASNAVGPEWFQIRTVEKTGSVWRPFRPTAEVPAEVRHMVLNNLMRIHLNYPHHSSRIFIHAIELFERAVAAFSQRLTNQFAIYKVLVCCYTLASKLDVTHRSAAPASRISVLTEARAIPTGIPEPEFVAMEEQLVREFNGDLLLQPGGLGEQLLRVMATSYGEATTNRNSYTIQFAIWLHMYAVVPVEAYGGEIATLWRLTRTIIKLIDRTKTLRNVPPQDVALLTAYGTAAARAGVADLMQWLLPLMYFAVDYPDLPEGGEPVFGINLKKYCEDNNLMANARQAHWVFQYQNSKALMQPKYFLTAYDPNGP